MEEYKLKCFKGFNILYPDGTAPDGFGSIHDLKNVCMICFGWIYIDIINILVDEIIQKVCEILIGTKFELEDGCLTIDAVKRKYSDKRSTVKHLKKNGEIIGKITLSYRYDETVEDFEFEILIESAVTNLERLDTILYSEI